MRKFVIFTINLLLLVVTPAFFAQILGKSAVSPSVPSSFPNSSIALPSKGVTTSFITTRYSNSATQHFAGSSYSTEKLLLKMQTSTLKASLTSTKTSPFSHESSKIMLPQKMGNEQWCSLDHLVMIQSFSS